METKTFTIDRVRFVDKWVEFWFAERDTQSEHFHECAKSDKLWSAIQEAGIYDEVLSTGLKGRRLVFAQHPHSLEIKEFAINAVPVAMCAPVRV